MLALTTRAYLDTVGHAVAGLPDEACGVLAADPVTGVVSRFLPCENAAASSQVYRIDPDEFARVDAEADAAGLVVAAVVHSHTHTSPYPSPTDVAEATPWWQYVIVSLKHPEPMLRSYSIVDGEIAETPVVVVAG